MSMYLTLTLFSKERGILRSLSERMEVRIGGTGLDRTH